MQCAGSGMALFGRIAEWFGCTVAVAGRFPIGTEPVMPVAETGHSKFASAARLATKPGSGRPPPRIQRLSSAATVGQSRWLTRRRSVDVCSRPAPRLNVKSTMAASRPSDSVASTGQ